jgi:hypothetical protein
MVLAASKEFICAESLEDKFCTFKRRLYKYFYLLT